MSHKNFVKTCFYRRSAVQFAFLKTRQKRAIYRYLPIFWFRYTGIRYLRYRISLICLNNVLSRLRSFCPSVTVTLQASEGVFNTFYNIAFVNSERWLAKSRVDITLCQHGKFPATFLLKFFVLYYKRNIKHFFRIDIQLYQHSWKLEKLEIVWKHSALRASCFHTISRFSNFHSCWYNCISTRKMFYIS